MAIFLPNRAVSRQRISFTLIEVVISIAIIGVGVWGLVSGYMMASMNAEWSAYSLAAQSLATVRIEQTRAAKWDPLAYPPVDEVVTQNFPILITNLDLPVDTNIGPVRATCMTYIVALSTNPYLKMIRVDCRWNFGRGRDFTNTIMSYRAADQ